MCGTAHYRGATKIVRTDSWDMSRFWAISLKLEWWFSIHFLHDVFVSRRCRLL